MDEAAPLCAALFEFGQGAVCFEEFDSDIAEHREGHNGTGMRWN
ncbi:MAG: hypothetical protein SOY73_01215 [Blautia sp.]|nr:hypothetical protein [Blautia sp.]